MTQQFMTRVPEKHIVFSAILNSYLPDIVGLLFVIFRPQRYVNFLYLLNHFEHLERVVAGKTV